LLLARRLQSGDPGGLMAEAAARFPFPAIVERVWKRYFIEGGKSVAKKFIGVPMHALKPSQDLLDLTVLANFVEVSLAKHGHPGLVGINLLEKIQLPTIPSLFGAMLAGVDYVLMGAGIPRAVPGILDQLAQGQATRLKIDVHGALGSEEYFTEFDTERYLQSPAQQLKRPSFLPSSHLLPWPSPWHANPPAAWMASSSKAGPLAATMPRRAVPCKSTLLANRSTASEICPIWKKLPA